MKVAIAGGGIGGLAAALCLADRGHDVAIFERSGAPAEVGAGIQISPNASRVIDALGLWGAFSSIATFPERIVLRRWSDDAVLRTSELGDDFRAQFGFDYANVHRADIAAMFAEALASRHGIHVSYARPVIDVDPGDDRLPCAVRFADGTKVDAEVIVGADGIHSAVRSCILGEQPARFSGAVAYRALIPRSALSSSSIEVTNRLGPDAHVVTYVIGRDDHLLNLVCVVPEKEWRTESWTEVGDPAILRSLFANWSPHVRSILDAVPETIHRWALHDREPLTQWGTARVTLLGDACHPMLPFMAQGACQAIEDAWVLAREIDAASKDGDVVGALRRYELARQGRTARVQNQSLRNRDVYHLPDGPEQVRRDESLSRRSGGFANLDWLYGFDPVRR